MAGTEIRSLANSKHFDRWARNKSGESIEEIAKKDKVAEKAVATSLRTVDAYRSRNTAETANHAISGVVINVMQKLEAALVEALSANHETEKDGKKTNEPDHSIRLKAVSEVREMAKVIQPKTPATQIGVSVGVGISDRKASGSYIGMEERMRDIRKEMKDRPKLAEAKVVQTQVLEPVAGEYVESEEDDDDE